MTRRPGWGVGVMTRRDMPMGTGSAKNSTSAPNIHQQDRFTTWRYTLSGVSGVLVMISSEPICRDEALRGLAQHYGCSRILSLTGGAHGR